MDRWKTVLWVLLITGLGAVLRFTALGSVPVGLYQDEAFNGLDALRVLHGVEHPLYFTANNGREPLFIYLVSMSIAWLGRTPVAVRLPAALLGTLTIPASAALASSLFSRRVGLLAAALVAISFWPLHLSRIGFRAVGLPLLLALALAAGWHGARRRQFGWVLVGGLFYGLAFYTYLPVYFTPVVLVLFAIYLWARGYRTLMRQVVPWFVLGTALALVPLFIALLSDPAIILGRTSQVSILNPAVNGGNLIGTLAQQIGRGLGMFFWRGDTIPRHNMPGRALFDPLVGAFFIAGLFWLLRHWRRPAAMLTLLWVPVMLAPTILAEDTPHFLRAVGVLPLACFLPALGLERGARWVATRTDRRWLAMGVPLLVLGVSLSLTVRDYFVRYAGDPLTGYAFQEAAVELADQMLESEGSVWASERFVHEWESIPFLLGEREVHWLSDGDLAQPAALPAELFVWPYESDWLADQLAGLPAGIQVQGWRGPLIKGDLEPVAYPLFWVYRVESGRDVLARPVATLAAGVRLQFADVTDGGACVPSTGIEHPDLCVVLGWSVEEKLENDYTVFVHLLEADKIVAQDDGVPSGGTLPTSWWRPGDQIVDVHGFSLSQAYDPAVHTVLVGLYDNVSRDRLAVLDATGRVIGDSVTLN